VKHTECYEVFEVIFEGKHISQGDLGFNKLKIETSGVNYILFLIPMRIFCNICNKPVYLAAGALQSAMKMLFCVLIYICAFHRE